MQQAAWHATDDRRGSSAPSIASTRAPPSIQAVPLHRRDGSCHAVPRRACTLRWAGERVGGRLRGDGGGISFTSLASSTRHFSLRDDSWRLRKAERYNLAAHRAKGAAGATKGVYPSNVASACAKCSLRRPLTATTNKPPWISAGMRRQGTAVATMLAHMCIEASERASVFGLPKRAPT
jgi:hypothetical protein